jgi:hypothetical protein
MRLLSYSFEVTAVVAWLLATPSVAQQRTEPSAILISTIASNGDFVVLPVQINNQWTKFCVDTGSATTFLYPKFCGDLRVANAEERADSFAYSDDPELYVPPPMTIAGTEFGAIAFPPGKAVACRDASDSLSASDYKLEGVLGMDFLSRYVVELDISNGTLKLFDPAKFFPSENHVCIETSPLRPCPCVKVGTGPHRYWALVDTGAATPVLIQTGGRENVYQRFVDEGHIQVTVVDARYRNLDFAVPIPEGRLSDLTLGPFAHRDLIVREDEISILGLDYLSRYKCVFDFPNRVIYLEKSRRYDVPDCHDNAGITIDATKKNPAQEGHSILSVARKSPAARLGVKPGDLLLRIDGQEAGELTDHNIQRRLNSRGDRAIELTFRRKDTEFRITIPPATQR